MTKQFNVLDRSQDIHRSYLLEASAGTGKTFSIENIVVRKLLEGNDPLAIEQILVVTFTRAATRDLKVRIRSNIEKCLRYILGLSTAAPDYLIAFCEQDAEQIQVGKRRLEQALFCFDQANIFTIHGFCARMLKENTFEGDLSLGIAIEDEQLPTENLERIVRDYLRTELHSDNFSTAQLKRLLAHYKNSLEKIENKLCEAIKSPIDIEIRPDYTAQFTEFTRIITQMKMSLKLSSHSILDDFFKQASSYTGIKNKAGEIKSDNLNKINRFAALFDRDTWYKEDFDLLIEDGLYLTEALHPQNRAKKSSAVSNGSLQHPQLIDVLNRELHPLIEEARNPLTLFARMAAGCQQLYRKRLHEEEQINFDELLKRMQRGLSNPLFCERVRFKFKAAIIDEFQDTDPIQWDIFNQLFMQDRDWGCLYLVGDPKQSIYAFRQADIYTYLAAADALGVDNHASLDTNYRSQPSMVSALNTLFSPEQSPGLIALPQINSHLVYHPVKASEAIAERTLRDNYGSVHFCIVTDNENSRGDYLERHEEEQYFPFFAEEISRLNRSDQIPLSKMAILVSDRYQGRRIAEYLKSQQIPCNLQRASNLAESSALSALRELLQAMINPRDLSALKIVLGGSIVRWTHEEIRACDNQDILEVILTQIQTVRKTLFNQGFAQFFLQFLDTKLNNVSDTLLERLLKTENGLDFVDHLDQIASLLIEREQQVNLSVDAMVFYLDQLSKQDINDNPKLKKISSNAQDSVNILTLHTSKGLEYDVVFAIGLIKRTKNQDALIPVLDKQNKRCLSAIVDKENPVYLKHCEEVDAEKIRQLYVAMTRAKYRLYVPLSFVPKAPEYGCASAIDLFTARFGQPKTDYMALYERMENNCGEFLKQFLNTLPSEIKITFSDLPKATICKAKQSISPESVILVAPHAVRVPGDNTFMYSFTTLAKNLKSKPSRSDLSPPHDFQISLKTAHTLPSGSDTGIILHKILEEIRFTDTEKVIDPKQLFAFVSRYTSGTVFSQWTEVLCQITYRALKMTLSANGTAFKLCAIQNEHLFRETEFLYPNEGLQAIEGIQDVNGFLKGVIDLIFMYEGKYYILDWKTNWLGPSNDYYEPAKLIQAMQDNQYYMQAKLYKSALEKYLRLVDSRSFSDAFGGVFYVFLRGIDINSDKKFGVLHFN